MINKPDGFTGALMAVESIEDARAVLHGPGGCRYRHVALSKESFPRDMGSTPEYDGPYFFSQTRIPCSFMDEIDYVNGAFFKISDCLKKVDGKGDGLVVVINSPGAALIGDDLEKAISDADMSDHAFSIDESLISVPFSFGYDRTIRSIIQWVAPEKRETEPDTVNILGYSILNKDWRNGLKELKECLSLMGLKVISSPGSGCSMDDIRRSTAASLNLVIMSEYGIETAKMYESEYGMPFISPDGGAPVGFDSTEDWINEVAKATGKDPTPALKRVSSYRQEASRLLASDSIKIQLMKANTYAIAGDSSVIYPIVRWFFDYLAILPDTVVIDAGSDCRLTERLLVFLKDIGCEDTVSDTIPDTVEILIAGGDFGRLMRATNRCRRFVDIGQPFARHTNFTPSPIVGATGAMYILDHLMNDY